MGSPYKLSEEFLREIGEIPGGLPRGGMCIGSDDERAERRLTLCRQRQRPARWLGWRPGPSRRRPNWTSSPPKHTQNTNGHTHFQVTGDNGELDSWSDNQKLLKGTKAPQGATITFFLNHILNAHNKSSPKQAVSKWIQITSSRWVIHHD